jgi:hypothetical protein
MVECDLACVCARETLETLDAIAKDVAAQAHVG